jgi:hypothetical protein
VKHVTAYKLLLAAVHTYRLSSEKQLRLNSLKVFKHSANLHVVVSLLSCVYLSLFGISILFLVVCSASLVLRGQSKHTVPNVDNCPYRSIVFPPIFFYSGDESKSDVKVGVKQGKCVQHLGRKI